MSYERMACKYSREDSRQQDLFVSQPVSEVFPCRGIRAYIICLDGLVDPSVCNQDLQGSPPSTLISNSLDGRHSSSFPIGINAKSPQDSIFPLCHSGLGTSISRPNSAVLSKLQCFIPGRFFLILLLFCEHLPETFIRLLQNLLDL